MSLFKSIASKLPAPAVAKHFAESLGEAIGVTLNRKHVPHTNSVINPTSHYVSGGAHHVGGQAWKVISGPKKNGQRAFMMAEPVGHQVDRFMTTGVGHREGPANAVVPYVAKPSAVAVRHESTAPAKFK